MFDYLHKMTWGYQITFETRMIYSPFEPSIKCSLIRWEENKVSRSGPKQRNVLLETSDPEQMESALLMLISEAEAQAKALTVLRYMP